MVKHGVQHRIIAGSGKMHFGNYDHGKSIQTAGDKAAKRAYEKGLTRREEDDERNCEISDGGKIERHLVISHDLADFPAQEPNMPRNQTATATSRILRKTGRDLATVNPKTISVISNNA